MYVEYQNKQKEKLMNAVNHIEPSQLQLPLVFSQICPQQQKDAIKAYLETRATEKITKKEIH